MSNQERLKYKDIISKEILSYSGFTTREKQFGLSNLNLVSEDGSIDRLINKFEEISLDIRPFIQDRGLARF
ncbi:MAG TPA: hypothetical protein ENK88_03300 [Campylobacterales bacterium]|nr:hypothetical protein [Campylobacterales bacterium]